jgi:hypothetical protein
MSKPRREFFKDLLALGAFPALAASPFAGRSMTALLDQSTAQDVNPDFDPKSFNFWSDFLEKDSTPITRPMGQTRGRAPSVEAAAQPVFLHYDSTEGFKNAAELDATKLLPNGDVKVSLNTSTIRVSPADQDIFNRLQNAQIRVDVAQRNSMLPVLEAMAYTVVSGMVSTMESSSSKTKSAAKPPSVQSVSTDSDAAWQKMQNIILPGGEGRWALNLEAQKKDSLFYKILQNVVKEGNLFAPVIGLPGIAMSALNSFNTLYGAIHAEPVQIIKSNPLRVFATQDSVAKTGSPGSVTGIMLKSGTYVLVPQNQTPTPAQLQNLTITQGRLVPPKTAAADLDAAAADTLKDVTYVTFDVQVEPTNVLSGGSGTKSSS